MKIKIILFPNMISAGKKTIFILIVLSGYCFAQNSLEEQFNYAKNLFDQEKYFDAITECKRLLFFDEHKLFNYDADLLIGLSYKAGAKYNDALKYFTLAEMNSDNDEQLFNANILSARTNILRRTTQQSERILNSLLANPKFSNRTKEIQYWLGWNYIFSNQWEKASEIFAEENLDSALTAICRSVVDDSYNVNFAKYSSYIIPGFGQFYTGEYLNGLISLGWNVLFGYLTINSFAEDRVFDGIVTGNFLWLRFYGGNTRNAEKFAKEKNLTIINNALNYLQENFAGTKP
ncbi:MAG: hypothetical protein RBR74_10315 [Ignavibacteriaceae bacterium]|nr:hypothetical protein [Ignavibacteriaceae bacterium]